MNFLTYLALRFAASPIGEGIMGGLGFCLLIVLSPVLLVLAPIVWIGTVYGDWKEFKDKNERED